MEKETKKYLIWVGIVACIFSLTKLLEYDRTHPSGTVLAEAPTSVKHHIPTPEGYVDIIQPESPGYKLYLAIKEDWKKADIQQPPGTIAALVQQSDLAVYYNGGPNPMNHQYCYITYFPNSNPSGGLVSLKKKFSHDSKLVMGANQELTNKIGHIKLGEVSSLGVVKEWTNGFIAANVVKITYKTEAGTKQVGKLLLNGITATKNGIYGIGDVSILTNPTSFDSAIARATSLTQALAAENP